MAPSLPVDLLPQIIEYAIDDPSTQTNGDKEGYKIAALLSLCRVSRLFLSIAQPLLFYRIIVETEAVGQKLAASDAFSKVGAVELVLEGAEARPRRELSGETAISLIKVTGTGRLKTLNLWDFGCLDAPVFELAPNLTSLDLQGTQLSGGPLSKSWNAQLVHLGIRYGSTLDEPLLSPLLTSTPTLTSLDLSGIGHQYLLNPDFVSFAAQITSLTLSIRRQYPTETFPFCSLSHLTFEYFTSAPVVIDILTCLSSEPPTLTHLKIPELACSELATKIDLQEKWTTLLHSKALAKLELITWGADNIGDVYIREVGDFLKAGRDVRVEWPGKLL
ncbi:hypothetical protein P7C70_g1413, partial [Phenoliferia sp. Uapishka_3]